MQTTVSITALSLILLPLINIVYGTPEFIDKPELIKGNKTHFNVTHKITGGQTSAKVTLFYENCEDQIEPNEIIQAVDPMFSGGNDEETPKPTPVASNLPTQIELSSSPSESSVSPSSIPTLSSDVPSITPTQISDEPSISSSSLPSQKIYHACPDVGAEPLEIVSDDGLFSVLTTSNDELCTLTLKTTTDTTETSAPLARSYDGYEWESVAGPHKISFQCDGNTCDGSAPSIDQNTQIFLLTSFGTSSNLNSEDIAARFFEQTTFGTTRSDILAWKDQVTTSSSSLDYSFAEWIKNQYDNVPATSLRQTFREQASARIYSSKWHGTPLHACDPNTRWHPYTFTRKDAGITSPNSLEVSLTSDGNNYLLSVNGVPRTEVKSIEVVGYGNLTVPGTYPFCHHFTSLQEYLGGQVFFKIDGVCRRLATGNPPIKFFSSNPQKPPRVITMSSPTDIDNFITLPGTVKDEELLLPNGLVHSDCDQISVGEYPVYLNFGDGNYLAFDPRLSLADNTVDNPLPDGGGKSYLLGSRCSNVPRTFLNSDSCVLSSITSTCSNEIAFTDVEILLTRDNLYALYDLTGKYIYAIDGLQAEQSPCILNSRSRWERINDSASCPDGETVFPAGDNTNATLKTLLENPNHDDFWLRDILYTDDTQQCETFSSTPKSTNDVKIIADSACWKLVNPDHYSVYDMSPWVSLHPGGPDKIMKWAVPSGMVLVYPHPDLMSRWETNKHQFPFIGVFNGTVPFRDLPSDFQLETVIQYFGIDSSDSSENIVVCGSPNEAGTKHTLGETGIAISIGDEFDDAYWWDKVEQRDMLWLKMALFANDQLRQRVAWGLSQIFPINSDAVPENSESEGFLTYYDIFVRNAFGNYFDILKEVSYSAMMAQMLSFIRNQSTYYNKVRRNIIVYPDENYAREIMQLFTIGTVMLNMDGTPKLDPITGGKILSYTNEHIMSYARAWTGFDEQLRRGNIERSGEWQPNRIDPMRIIIDYRDILPKIDLKDGYIGDGYPLCSDMPERSFLRKGASYRLLGSSMNLQLSTNPASWMKFDPTKKMLSLGPSSELYNVLCNPTTPGGSDCSFRSEVKIIHNLACHGQECLVDTVNLVEVTPGIYFEYVRQPCVELSYYQNPRTVTWSFRNIEMCADPKTIVAREACCTPNQTGTIVATAVKCEYANERVTFQTAEDRCATLGMEICNYKYLSVGALDPETCGAHYYYYHWHGSDCLLKVKVNNESGYAAIVHQPTAMINDKIDLRFREDSIYYFPVHWDSTDYPNTSNSCGNGACSAIEGGCLCNTTVLDDVAFSSAPADADDILSTLHVGSVSPDSYDDGYFDSPVTQGDYQIFFRSGQSYDMDTVFRVEENTQLKYYKNIVSTVQVIGANAGATSYSFRNPPHFINFQVPDERDAHYETDAVLESYFHHPNTAPFIASYMIQKFGISNPSPRYVEAVATAFKKGVYDYDDGSNPVVSYGSNKYGDMRSTIAAIILDRESRSLVLDYDSSKGSLREPLLKVVAFMRSMEYEAFPDFRSGRQDHKLYRMTSKIGQMLLSAPSIFSFFRPEFTPVGSIAEASLVSPEAQQYVAPSIIGFANGYFSLIKWGLSECFGGFNRSKLWCGNRSEGDKTAAWGEVTLTPENSSNYANTVDELATLLTSGRLSTVNRNLIANEMTRAADDAAALRLAQQLIGVSPEFHSTNTIEFTGEDRQPPPPSIPSTKPFKAVIYLLTTGGMDSFNLLVPHSGCTKDMYTEYATVRTTIAIPQAELLPIGTGGIPQVCTTFGIHPDLPILQELYANTDLSFFSNVGVLFEEVTKADWFLKTHTQLFAHNVQQKDTQQIDPFKNVDGTGVMGRMADVLTKNAYNTGSYSISGDNHVLIGKPQKSPSVNFIGISGVTKFNEKASIDDMNVTMAKLNNPTTAMSGKFGKTWSDLFDSSVRQTEALYQALNDLTLDTTFPTTNIGRRLDQVAKVMKARNELGNDRQFFYIDEGGWDTHANQKAFLDLRMKDLNTGISAFKNEMVAQGLWDSVTLVMASDFGRTLVANSNDGTDHAWGGNYFVLGGSMNGVGGKILGEYPDNLTDAGPLNIGRGRLIPTTSWDAIFNAVAQWAGVTEEADLAEVLPNRNKFNGLFTREQLFASDPVVP